MSDGRKIKPEYENPYDNLIYIIVEKIAPVLHSYNLTPNMVTTMSFTLSLLSAYLLFNKHYLLAAILFLISYIFDCTDGYMARKYNMVSKFGDYYDHITDFIGVFLIIMIFIYHKQYYKIYIFILLGFLCGFHMKCQEELFNKNNNIKNKESDSIEKLLYIFSCKDTKYMKFTRYFGCGTLNVVIILLMLYN